MASYEDMRDMVARLAGTVKTQATLLEQLTASPLALAPVIAVGSTPIPPASRKAFTKGNQARVTEGWKQGQAGEIVQINESADGSPLSLTFDGSYLNVRIKFRDGSHEWYQPEQLEVINPTDEYVIVFYDGKHVQLRRPPFLNLRLGDLVKLSMETMQIVDKADMEPHGEIVTIKHVHDGSIVEVDYQGSPRVVLSGQFNGIEKGDLVILDASGYVIMHVLGRMESRFTFSQTTNVSWDDIGGLTDAKAVMREVIEDPVLHANLYQFYGKQSVKGVLLYGPPGNGKTLLGKATATALARLHHATDGGFLYVKGPEMLDRYIGVAEATIRQMFEHARRFYEEHGYPAVIFIDEADAIMGKRGTGISSDVERTIVPTFLTEMDGLEASGAVVILATNRPDVLDPAIVRDGRIDRKIKIDRPTPASAQDIFSLYLRRVPFSNGYTAQGLAGLATASLFNESRVLYDVLLQGGTTLNFTLSQLVSGAMIAGIIDQATSIAVRRDLVSGSAPEGLRASDLLEAIDLVFAQNYDLDHREELTGFTREFHADVQGIQKRRLVAA